MKLPDILTESAIVFSNGVCPELTRIKWEAGYLSVAYCVKSCELQEINKLRFTQKEVGRHCINPIVMNDFPTPKD